MSIKELKNLLSSTPIDRSLMNKQIYKRVLHMGTYDIVYTESIHSMEVYDGTFMFKGLDRGNAYLISFVIHECKGGFNFKYNYTWVKGITNASQLITFLENKNIQPDFTKFGYSNGVPFKRHTIGNIILFDYISFNNGIITQKFKTDGIEIIKEYDHTDKIIDIDCLIEISSSDNMFNEIIEFLKT